MNIQNNLKHYGTGYHGMCSRRFVEYACVCRGRMTLSLPIAHVKMCTPDTHGTPTCTQTCDTIQWGNKPSQLSMRATDLVEGNFTQWESHAQHPVTQDPSRMRPRQQCWRSHPSGNDSYGVHRYRGVGTHTLVATIPMGYICIDSMSLWNSCTGCSHCSMWVRYFAKSIHSTGGNSYPKYP